MRLKQRIHEIRDTATSFGGSEIKHFGTAKIPCEFKGIKITATFYVTDTSGPAIIGLHTATQLNLVKFNLEDLIARYPECFDGIGKLKGEYHITLDPAVPPAVQPPRKVRTKVKWKAPPLSRPKRPKRSD